MLAVPMAPEVMCSASTLPEPRFIQPMDPDATLWATPDATKPITLPEAMCPELIAPDAIRNR